MAAQCGDLAVEHEPAARVGPAPDDEHAHALGKLRERGAELLVELQTFRELRQAHRRLRPLGAASCHTRSRSSRPSRSGARIGGIASLEGTPAQATGRVLDCPRSPSTSRKRSRAVRETLDHGVGDRHGVASERRAPQASRWPARKRLARSWPSFSPAAAKSRSVSSNGRRSSSTEPCWRTCARRGGPGRSRRASAPPPAGRRPAGRRSRPVRPGPRDRPTSAASPRAIAKPGDQPRRQAARRPPRYVRHAPSGRRHRDGIGEVPAVQQRPAPGRAAHHVDARAAAHASTSTSVAGWNRPSDSAGGAHR